MNEDNDGNKRINIKFTAKEDLSPQQRNARRGGGGQQPIDRQNARGNNRSRDDDGFDDDIPF